MIVVGVKYTLWIFHSFVLTLFFEGNGTCSQGYTYFRFKAFKFKPILNTVAQKPL